MRALGLFILLALLLGMQLGGGFIGWAITGSWVGASAGTFIASIFQNLLLEDTFKIR